MNRTIRLTLVSAVCLAALVGCTSTSEPSWSPSSEPANPPSTTDAPSMPPSDPATTTPTATESEPDQAAAVPTGWTPISPTEAGVIESEVDEVIGAWRLPSDGVASVTRYKNDVGSANPDEVFAAYFGDVDDPGYTRSSRETVNGHPVLVVEYESGPGDGGESQTFFFVLTPEEITSALISGTPNVIDDGASDLWAFVSQVA